ncbi:MAG: Gfo/Idh/MocA family oxidoreductase [Acidobacteria bacterium]|nr:Gfo/Idh/MocA family oxidoreductase [Acidobacteriota bacterium]
MTRRESLAALAPLFTAAAPDPAVRIGIVGGRFGAGFQWHLDPDCRVDAVCDIRDDALDNLAKTYGCRNRYKSYSEMLRHAGLNAVGIFTPAPLHVPMAVEALKAGKHVISAVPAGMNVEELELLLETVRKTGLRYMMAETSFYRPEIITCRQWAAEGRFGTIFHSEAEYHHEGLIALMFEKDGKPTWRHGFPPMHYPTHSTGLVIPVINERLREVSCLGWGDGHEVLKSNVYKNPFWSETALFKTSSGHASRIMVSWHISAGEIERGLFYGDKLSYVMRRPEGSPNTVFVSSKGTPREEPDYFETLPPAMRVKTGHGNSHTFITHEFVRAVAENRHPTVNVWEAIAYTLPGIVAHQSALRGGETLKIRDYGRAG